MLLNTDQVKTQRYQLIFRHA